MALLFINRFALILFESSFVKQIPFDLFVYTFYSRHKQNKCKYLLAQNKKS